ncbi:MAG: APC family permease [Micrococcales bacterium]|nr:APC family permease [Micrococcales bacterium]MCL2668066.1 APC family permease [Micrococcales bacterium]
MPDLRGAAKRLLVGRPVRSENLGRTLLPKRLALPVFASDAISSVAYAPDEILLTLAFAGTGAALLSPWVGVAVALVMVVVIASYRQNVHAYPSGGGDYEVATTNVGSRTGLTVASALLVDYVLTVAVSVAAGTAYAAAALPVLHGHEAKVGVAVVLVLTVVNLRGVRESGRAVALPVYLYIGAVALTVLVGFVQRMTGNLGEAESASYQIVHQPGLDSGLVGLAGAVLVLRAFASGSVALTGVEAISNGVPAFRKPKAKNAATTLGVAGAVSATLLVSILVLSRMAGVVYVDDPSTDLVTASGQPAGDAYHQYPVVSQLAHTVFGNFMPAFYFVAVVAGVILLLAANTAFNGFPVLGSILARDGYLPRQLHTRGDRLAYSNGILTLAVAAIVLIWAFDAQVTRLIQLYIVGVFVSFTLSQLGMVRHWRRLIPTQVDPQRRTSMRRSHVINTVGLAVTGTVLVVVLVTKFTYGAWIAVAAMLVVFVLMNAIHHHYATVRTAVALDDDEATSRALPSRVHAIVLISNLHRPTMRAIAYARAARPSVLEVITVGVNPDDVDQLRTEWNQVGLPLPLKVLDSPFREITRPVLTYVRSIRRESPRDLVVVYVPEYVVGHWWEALLHNQSAMRLKRRLLFMPGVVVASVPWQLESSARTRNLAEQFDARPLPGDTRRGLGGPQQ